MKSIKKKRLNDNLPKRESSLQIMEYIDEGYVCLSKDLKVLHLNKRISYGLGINAESIIGKSILDLNEELIACKTVERIKNAIQENRELSCIEFYKPLGVWFECVICPSEQEVCLLFKKVNSPNETESEQLNLENRARLLLERSEDVIVLSNLDGEIISVNRAFEQATGYSAHEVIGKSRVAFLLPEEIEKSVHVFDDLASRPGQSIEKTTRLISKEKETIWLKGKITNMVHEPSIKAFVSNFHDITSLKKAEAVLVSNENLYHKLFEHLLYGFVYAKAIRDKNNQVIDFEYISANKAYEEIVQFNNVIGKKISELRKDFFVNPPEFMPGVRKVMDTGLAHTEEFYVARIQKWLSLTYYSAEPDYFGCIVDDITEHKTLYEQQRYIASIVNSSEDAIISKDLEGNILSWNKSAERLYGYSEEEAKKMNVSVLIPNDRAFEGPEIIEKIKTGKHVQQYETTRITKNKVTLDVSLSISPIHNVEGKIVGASVIARDIRESLRQKKQEALLASIINYTQDAILSRDLNGIITSWNSAAEKLFGYTQAEAIGMHASKLFPSDLSHELKMIDELLLNGQPVKYFETERINKFGEKIYVSLVVSPIYSLGMVVGASVIIRDVTEKKIFENKLRESENNLKIIFENSEESFLFLDFNCIVKAFNSKMKNSALTKFGEEELCVGKSIFNFTNKARANYLMADLKRAFDGETFSVEIDAYTDYQSPFWFKSTYSPVKENGKVIGVCIAVNDITTAKLAEGNLKQSENNLKAVFNNSTQGFVLLNKDFEIQLFNENADQYTFNSSLKHLIIGNSILSIVDENKKSILLQHLNDVVNKNIIHSVEMYSEVKGELFLEITLSPVYGHKEITGVCVNINNITDKKLIEQERLFDQRNLEALINNTSDMMWSIDKDYQLVTFNKPFERHMENVVGKKLVKGISLIEIANHAPVFNRFIENLSRALKGESFTEVEAVPMIKDTWIESSFYPTFQNDLVIGTACFVRNISELKKREQEKEIFIKELTQSNADLRQFAYITSHNLRGPIANLLGLTNLLDHYPVKNATLMQILEGIKKAAKRFDETVKDLTQILTIKDNLTVPSEVLKFENSLNLAMEQCQDIITESKANIISDFSKYPIVHFNKSYLDSILMNLLTNAIKYRDFARPLEININTQLEEGFIVLTFQDNGIGFDATSNENKLFKLYQRFHTEREGKGMGLFLIRTQLETLGGKVSVESKINEGTIFKLKFKK